MKGKSLKISFGSVLVKRRLMTKRLTSWSLLGFLGVLMKKVNYDFMRTQG